MAVSQNNEVPNDLSDIKRKLAWRMGIAGLLIVCLLGGLALFDYMSSRVESEPAAVHYTEPVPVAKKTITRSVTPNEPVSEVREEKKEAAPETSAVPVDKSAPKMDLPSRPEVAAQPALPKPTPSAARTGTGSPAAAGAKSVETRAVPATVAPMRNEPASLPTPSSQQQLSPPRLFSGFAVQAGVFSDPRRAEELHARLALEGIPSTIEARVQAGPFKSKEEAEAARIKMKALGIDAVMLMPKGVRR